jgi:hypothetical protein
MRIWTRVPECIWPPMSMGMKTDTAPDDHRAIHHHIRPDASRIID